MAVTVAESEVEHRQDLASLCRLLPEAKGLGVVPRHRGAALAGKIEKRVGIAYRSCSDHGHGCSMAVILVDAPVRALARHIAIEYPCTEERWADYVLS